MRYFLETGTDAACVALFDPSALPDDFVQRWEEGPIEFARALQQDGRMFFVETGSDGAYSIGLFVDEEVPEHVRPHLTDSTEMPRFHIPGGKLVFSGGEEAGPMLRVSDTNQASLTLGEYRATFWRGEYPHGMVEDLVKRQLGPARHGLETLVGTITGLGFASTIFLLFALLFSWFARWTWIGLAVSLPLTVVGLLILKIPYFGRMQAERREIEKDYPCIIGEMRLRKPTDGS